ncbi:outer membrane protein assembly factor BamD [Paracrocinitomix mangrovi]|uniref:outer membrane protein assembly factor BamD n=1 Tax=Paracrocinitomix mangrovi TaxID=2862509 RepID=UPI001EDC6A16|nr:outer membrane protein assembly factor BamD [Paracrocinitomix mangrovi]UKN01276.1 outer membrane protein assembly factor BamD [Paracrocinitomix mangrovi]
MIKLSKTILMSLVALLMLSCSEYNQILKSGDNERKKNAALKYYEEEDYLKSVTLLEDVIPFYKITSEGEKLYFYYCMSNYELGDYYLAGYYFKRFIRQYPTSKFNEKAAFLSALCAVQNSPNYKLDQTETLNALDELQIFIDLYPNSTRIDTCNQIMDRLRGKLELKQYENAMLYYKTENYKAAVVALEGTLEKYPESQYKESILFHAVKSSYFLAINSIESKKKERLEETLKRYRTFVAAFPESGHSTEVESYKEKTEQELTKIKESSSQ